MTRRMFAPAILALLLVTTPAQAQQAAGSSPLRAEVDSLNRAMEQAFAKRDMLAVARFYADDGVILGPRGFRTAGRKDIDAYWRGLRDPRSWKLDVLDVGGSRDDAWQLGRSTLVTGGPGGDQTSVVNFIVIWKRQADGSLRIAIDFYN